MTVSVFSLIKNESQFIGYGLMSVLPYVDEVVYFDGNSTDGTLELLTYIKTHYDPEGKIKVFKDRDFKDFKDDYVRVFNECMKECHGKFLWYLHPDMILTDPGRLVDRENWTAKAMYVNMRSFAGVDADKEIVEGRTDKWKTIMLNAFGLHYWGWYGHEHEDMYFREITGDEHIIRPMMGMYPFKVEDSKIKLWHFCECKPLERRKQKMETVIRTCSGETDEERIRRLVDYHPRVHLENSDSERLRFTFAPRKDPLPDVFQKYKAEFDGVLGK